MGWVTGNSIRESDSITAQVHQHVVLCLADLLFPHWCEDQGEAGVSRERLARVEATQDQIA